MEIKTPATGILKILHYIASKNSEFSYEAVGNKIDVIMVSRIDFDIQNAFFILPDMYWEFHKPFHKRANNWIDKNTSFGRFFIMVVSSSLIF